MRFVDGEKRKPQTVEKAAHTRGHEPLGSDVEEIHFTALQSGAHVGRLFGCLRRIEVGGANARFLQGVDLILHESDKRRNHHRHAVAQESGYLVAKTLAAARGHQHQGVPPLHDGLHDLFLESSETVVTEDTSERFLR